ncbi:MAG: peptidylprolyl isomerase [Winogradskyella sp.]|nr:peptidylprolyl isomerase [Winogradskyella sp.]NNK39992.1 peptidylprolyl isomerase [Winogradskyella sp.]
MRILIVLFLFVLFTACEDKQSKREPISKNHSTLETKVDTSKKEKKPKRKYPRLTEETAMDFFLEYEKEHNEDKVRITTDFGDIEIQLYDKTKFHRANFIFLTKQNYFDGTQFYRVVNDFVIQGGSSDDFNIAKRRQKIGRYLLPKDTKRGYTHKRGVISMPSSEIENPHKLASPYEFFIVQRRGGAPYLDGDYTIFGEVIKGMDVVDKIAAQPTDDGEWPLQNIYIRTVEIIN